MEKEKKEIWKLIELFKEYVDKYSNDAKVLDEWEYVVIDDGQSFLYWTREYSYLTLISKKFWFIKWLVENDKIDVEKEIKNSELNWLHEHYLREDCLLMLLSISDTPIEDLISYLK
jgi:hypothetical protein